ncbi:hypothetical protein [Cohnella cholangitidis]|nr:hypothetical protein [Cohnella cholangitidis]
MAFKLAVTDNSVEPYHKTRPAPRRFLLLALLNELVKEHELAPYAVQKRI